MKKCKWEVLFGCGQKRFVTAKTESQARTEAQELLPASIKYIRKCNRR